MAQDRGARIVIGLAAVVGACVLVYFSATPTLECTAGREYAECAATARVLDLFEVSRDHVTDVRSVGLLRTTVPGSDTPPHLVFRDATGERYLGYFSQRFAREWQKLDAFVRQPTADGIRLTEPVTFRRVAAHAAALFMALLGLLVLNSARSRA